jgi:predicted enzyme related to lactoylglutathione lyase
MFTLVAPAWGGGDVTGEPMEICGVGLHALFRDPEGNPVSVLQSISPELPRTRNL